jgi:hypothetical protein
VYFDVVSVDTDDKQAWGDRVWAALIAVGFAVVYLVTAARHLLGGDPGEFAVVAGSGGFAHPPGYPLYSMYLAGAAGLPISSAAHEAAMATALLGAAALGVLYLGARAWGASRFGALFGVLLFGLAPEIWFLHTVPEPFALNHLVVAAVVWLAAPAGPVRGGRRMVALGLVAAVCVAHHHMAVLVAPVGLFGVYRALVESERSAAGLLAAGAGCVALGFVPYGYLVWVTASVPEAYHWGEVGGLSDLVHTFLRRDYGTFELTSGGERVGPLWQIATLVAKSSADLSYAPVLLAAVAMVRPFVLGGDGEGDAGREMRIGKGALIGSVLLSGPLFVALIGRGISGADYLHLRKFHAQFELLVALFVALGATWLAGYISKRWLRGVMLAAVVLGGGLQALPYLEYQRGPTVEQYVRDTLEPLPEGAVLVGDSDHRYFGFQYAQRVLGLRQDVTYVDIGIIGFDWHRRRIERRLGVESGADGGETKLSLMFRNLLEAGYPVFMTHFLHEGLGKYWTLYPVGTTYRVRPSEQSGPPLVEVYRRNRRLIREFRIEPRPHVPETSWNHLVLTHYGLVWREMAEQLDQAGMGRRAAESRQIMEELAPWLGRSEKSAGGTRR